jgi:hypothetical protein
MQSLLEAISARFAADSVLTAAFPGGLWGEAAPEGTALPYVVQSVVDAPVTCVYGAATRADVKVRLSAYGIGRDATMAKAELLAAAFKDVTLTLSAGKNYDARQLTGPQPERQGRDSSTADDAGQGDVYAVHVVIEYAVRV